MSASMSDLIAQQFLPVQSKLLDYGHGGIISALCNFASLHSTDPSTRVGAIVVSPNGELLSDGVNSIPEGVETIASTDPSLKYNYFIHAEAAAVANAARLGRSTLDATMYATWAACPACAHAIIQAGIQRLVTSKLLFELTDERWLNSVALGHALLRSAGIELQLVDGDGSGKILFKGKLQTV